MPDREVRNHYGPEPRFGIGPEIGHAHIHELSVGKTVARVYLGDDEPLPPEIPNSEYVVFEFTDGSLLGLQIGSGNSFAVATDPNKLSPHVEHRRKEMS